MIKLSIITINYNNVAGLRKTMESVLSQCNKCFEYIVIDGNSIDGSKEVILQFADFDKHDSLSFQWKSLSGVVDGCFVSESDGGIYNAMNKGIKIAKGEYVQFLNSGDCLVSNEVTENMLNALPKFCSIFYGNMMKQLPKKTLRDCGFAGRIPSMIDFYSGTLNHSSTYIQRILFESNGYYDESLKIVSDWKWFLEVIVFKGVMPVYKDIDVTLFDMTGISNTNIIQLNVERRQVLEKLFPLSVLMDYDQYSLSIFQLKRIKKYWLVDKCFYLIDRLLNKFEIYFELISSSFK